MVVGYCAFSNLRTAVKLFAAFLQIKDAKIIVVEDSGHKCICNNSTRESENLKEKLHFCKSYILKLKLMLAITKFSPVSRMKCSKLSS